MKRQLCIRTVLDARSRSTKHLYQLLLLVASWHKRIRHTAPLEVFVIGEPPESLLHLFRELRVHWASVLPDENDSISRTSNTIVGARDKHGHRILLVDNDVVFVGDLEDLTQVDDDLCLGAVAGNERVSAAHWRVIEEHFRMPLLATVEVPLSERVRQMIDPSHQPNPLRNVYVNGGVILVPADSGFEDNWRRYVREIAALFARHPLKSKCVYGSNMAALAMAITAHGKFEWLHLKYNYRPDCFAMDVEPFRNVQIAHLTGVDDSHRNIRGRIDAFWQDKMQKRFRRARPDVGEKELQSCLSEANLLRDELDALVCDYDLERRAAGFPRHNGELLKTTWNRHVKRPFFRLYGEMLSSASRLRRRLLT